MSTEYFDVQSLSHYIPRSPGAIRNLVLRRTIPFRKVGGRLIFEREEIDKWIRSSEGLSFDEIKAESVGAVQTGGRMTEPAMPQKRL
jgi:hypothetical protein